jgi:hypothetical protein
VRRRIFLGFLVAVGTIALHVPLFWYVFAPHPIRWRPIKAAFSGPFPEEKRFSLTRYNKDRERSKFIRSDEASVLAAEDGKLSVTVTFTFVGPKLKSRRILLAIHALDDAGRVLAKTSRRCSDSRIRTKPKMLHLSGNAFRMDPVNREVFPLSLPPKSAKQVRRVEIFLREA